MDSRLTMDYVEIKTVRDFMQALRCGSFTSMGYTLVFYTNDGDPIAPHAARAEVMQEARKIRDRDFDRIAYHAVYWEGPNLTCALSNEEIESSYGDPDADNADAESES